MTLALIDGDIVAYRAAIGAQADIDWGDGQTGPTVSPQAAADAACQTVDAWMRLARCKDSIVCFTGRENFRKRVLPTYKANRAGKVKPQAYNQVVEAVRDRFNCQMVEGLEADDLLGIMLTTLPKYDRAICMTLDKDLRTVPGLHLNPTKEDRPVHVDNNDGLYRWLTQTLTGDTSDGYVGIPRVGPKKAEKILGSRWLGDHDANLAYGWAQVVKAFLAAKLTEADALVQARVARILRRSDYDKDTKDVLLWHPTTPERLSLHLKA